MRQNLVCVVLCCVLSCVIFCYLGPLVLSSDCVDIEEVRGGPLQELGLKLVTCVVDDHDGAGPDQRRRGVIVHWEHRSVLD